MIDLWKYSDTIERERQGKLLSAESFADIAERITCQMSILCYHRQDCDDDSRFARSVFCVQVSDELFDAFFNSPKGYRACYFKSPFYGLECNRLLLELLLPHVSEWAMRNSPTYNPRFSRDSLLAVSAKAWLAEVSMELCSRCAGEWSRPNDDEPEIINGRWDVNQLPNAKFGRMAPQGSKIRLFGAFLSTEGNEFVPSRKRERHQHIHLQGWS